MKKVLIIGYVWPEPASSAAGSHMMSILRLFKQQGWQVEFSSPSQLSEHSVDLAGEGISTQSIALNCDSFDAYIQDFCPDIVLFDRFMMEEQFGWRVEKNCPDALKILDTEDLQCLRNARHQAHKAGREMQQSDLSGDLAKREIAAILRCDISLIISSFEMDLLTSTFNVDASVLHYLPFMPDPKKYPQKTPDFSSRKHFMTIGNFRHAPNWDMVLYLQEIWPLIRQQVPEAELHIYGAYAPPKATALNNVKSGFIIKGRADNVFTLMEQYRLCLAPLRFGAGIKGKLIDAMIMQTPSITTPVGSEGMHQQEPWPGVIANNAAEFAEAAVLLYQNESLWCNAQANASALLNTRFEGKVSGGRFISRVIDVIAHLSQHRLDNFTGAMLRYHLMAGTKYMSQWIAEKNRNKVK